MYKVIEKDRGVKFIDFYNYNDFHVVLSNYGASIYEIGVPNSRGIIETVTLTPKSPYYFNNNKYLGLTVGRVAGRIEKGEIKIGNKVYNITPNEKGNALHSSKCTFAYKFFDFSTKDYKDKLDVIYSIHIKDMEDEYPGDLDLTVTYSLYKKENIINVSYEAISNKDTALNITNHSYFNLSGDLSDNILKHELMINKDYYSKEREDQIFTKLIKVDKPFDFRNGKTIGEDIEDPSVQEYCYGYDHMFSDEKDVYLSLKDPVSKRKMIIESDHKDVVIYTNNWKTETVFINDKVDKKYLGIAIEPSKLSLTMKQNGLTVKANNKYKHYIKYTFINEN